MSELSNAPLIIWLLATLPIVGNGDFISLPTGNRGNQST